MTRQQRRRPSPGRVFTKGRPTTTLPLSQIVGTLTLSSITALLLSTEDSLVSLPRLFSLPIFSLSFSVLFPSQIFLPALSFSLPFPPSSLFPICLLVLCCERCSLLLSSFWTSPFHAFCSSLSSPCLFFHCGCHGIVLGVENVSELPRRQSRGHRNKTAEDELTFPIAALKGPKHLT